MNNSRVPITRIGKFFSDTDFQLEVSFGEEWLYGDMNFTLVLYRIDRIKTKKDDVYGEVMSEGIQYLPPIEINAYVQIEQPTNIFLGNSKITQMEPGNMRFSVYQKMLDEMGIEINYGDYIGYYETEDRVRYYVVNNDGRINSDNRHTYAGYKPFYKTYIASPVSNEEFNGI
jgi:hypothetical protein